MSQFDPPEPPSHGGFSLLELLAVLTVLALATGLFVTQIGSGTSQASARQLAATITAELQEARRKAIASGDAVPVAPRSGQTDSLTSGKTIWFYPDGSSSGGTFTIRDPNWPMTVSVEPFIGSIAISRGTNDR